MTINKLIHVNIRRYVRLIIFFSSDLTVAKRAVFEAPTIWTIEALVG